MMQYTEVDSFDPDDVDIRPFVDQTETVLWQNVTRTAAVIAADSSYKPLLVFSFVCKAFLRIVQCQPDWEKRDKLTIVYRELLDRCHIPADQADERFTRSLNVKWILMNQMKQLELRVDHVRDAVNSVMLSLAEQDVKTNMQLISLIERGKHDSDELLNQLKQLLVRDPFVAAIIIKQMNELLLLSEKAGSMYKIKSYNFIVRDALMHAIEDTDDVHSMINLLHIIPEEEIANERLQESVRGLAARLDFMLNDPMITGNKWSAFFAAVAGRQSLTLAKVIFDLRWDKIKELDASNEEDMLISGESFNHKNCILLALREEKHFMQQLLDRDVSRVDQLPRSFRLHHLLVKMYDASERDKFLLYSGKLESLISTSHILLSRDPFSTELVLSIQWIYDFTHWAIDNLRDRNCRDSADVIKEKMLIQLFNCDPPLQVLSKVGLLSSISTPDQERFDAISEEMASKLNAYESPAELMSWYAFLCMRLGFSWLTTNPKDKEELSSSSSNENVSIETIPDIADSIGEESDEDLEEASMDVEFSSRIRNFLKSIKSLTLRTEVLEDLFSLLFLTNRNLQKKRTCLPEAEEEEELKFLIRNEVVPKYLAFLKDATFDAQTHVRSRLRRTQNASPTEQEEEYDQAISSCKDLSDAKMRLEVLLQSIHEGQWRYSVIEQSFHQEASENAPSIMQSMLASPQQLLRHSLTHGHVDQAKQVYKLFENQLRGSEESIQLRVSEKIQLLGEKIRLLMSTGKRYHNQTPHQRTMFEATAKSMKISQIGTIFTEFLTDATAITGHAETANILLIDYGLTRSASMEVSQIAIETGVANLDPKSAENKQMIEFLNRIVSLIVVAKNSPASFDSNMTLPQLLSFNTNQSLFSNPASLIEESLKKKKLSECIEDIRHMIRGPQEEQEQDEGDSGRISDYTSDGKKLVILFQKLLRLCPPGRHNYLKGLFYHVRRVSRVLNECRNRSRSHSTSSPRMRAQPAVLNTSYFSVLYQSPSAILCQMVLKEGVPPTLVHDLSLEMKVDLIGTLCSILCPPIKVVTESREEFSDFNLISTSYPALCDLIESFLTGSIRKMLSRQDTESSILIENHFKQDYTGEETYDQEHNRSIISKPDLILYFKKKSPVLVEVLRLLKLIDERKISVFDDDIVINKKTPLGKYILMIRKLFANGADNNDTGIVTIAMTPYLSLSNTIIMKSLEDYAEKSDLMSIYNILHFTRTFSDNVFNSSLESLHTAVLSKLAVQEEEMMYILQIENCKTKVDLLVENINMAKEQESVYTDAPFCLQAIDAVMGCVKSQPDGQSQHLVSRLKQKQKEIHCYSKIALLAGLKTWIDASENLTEADILTILKTKKQYSLALEWDDLMRTAAGQMDASTDPQIEELRCELLLMSYAEKEMDDEMAKLIPTVLSINSNLVLKSMNQIDNWRMKEVLIRISIEFQQDMEKKSVYTRYLLGIQLIELLPLSIRQHYSALISKPNLIIEQMLMNTEYQALEQALKIRQLINCDDLIEIYSRKALDIKLIQEDASSYNGSDYTCISSSFVPDTGSASGFFAMPMSVPTKDQWVPDHKVQYCMVCKIEKFSSSSIASITVVAVAVSCVTPALIVTS